MCTTTLSVTGSRQLSWPLLLAFDLITTAQKSSKCSSLWIASATSVLLYEYNTVCRCSCWLLPADGFVWSFVGPVTLIIAGNMVFLVIALSAVFRTQSPGQINRMKRMRGWLRGSVMLLCLLGTTWLFGFLYINNTSTIIFAYVFTILNSLQVRCASTRLVLLLYKFFLDFTTWKMYNVYCLGFVHFPISLRDERESLRDGATLRSTLHLVSELVQAMHRYTANFLVLGIKLKVLNQRKQSSKGDYSTTKSIMETDYKRILFSLS